MNGWVQFLPLLSLVVGTIVVFKALQWLLKPYFKGYGSMHDELNYGLSRGTSFTYRRTFEGPRPLYDTAVDDTEPTTINSETDKPTPRPTFPTEPVYVGMGQRH